MTASRELRSAHGRVHLVEERPIDGVRRATLMAQDGCEALRFLRDLCTAWAVDLALLPSRAPESTGTVACHSVSLGRGADPANTLCAAWELALPAGLGVWFRDDARPGHDGAALVEQDPAWRAAIVRVLAAGLLGVAWRDPERDPLLRDPRPRLGPLERLKIEAASPFAICVSGACLLVAQRAEGGSRVVSFDLDGRSEERHHPGLQIRALAARNDRVVAFDDGVPRRWVALRGEAVVPLVTEEDGCVLQESQRAVLSPDGSMLALELGTGCRVIALDAPRTVAVHPEATPVRWDHEGLVLGLRGRWQRAHPDGGAAPIPIAESAPDGAWSLAWHDATRPAVVDAAGRAWPIGCAPEDLPALRALAEDLRAGRLRWTGPHHLAVTSGDLLELDLATRSWRVLVPWDAALQHMVPDPERARVIVLDRRGTVLTGGFDDAPDETWSARGIASQVRADLAGEPYTFRGATADRLSLRDEGAWRGASLDDLALTLGAASGDYVDPLDEQVFQRVLDLEETLDGPADGRIDRLWPSLHALARLPIPYACREVYAHALLDRDLAALRPGDLIGLRDALVRAVGAGWIEHLEDGALEGALKGLDELRDDPTADEAEAAVDPGHWYTLGFVVDDDLAGFVLERADGTVYAEAREGRTAVLCFRNAVNAVRYAVGAGGATRVTGGMSLRVGVLRDVAGGAAVSPEDLEEPRGFALNVVDAAGSDEGFGGPDDPLDAAEAAALLDAFRAALYVVDAG